MTDHKNFWIVKEGEEQKAEAPVINQELVDSLTTLLEYAKSGKIISIAVVTLGEEGGRGWIMDDFEDEAFYFCTYMDAMRLKILDIINDCGCDEE